MTLRLSTEKISVSVYRYRGKWWAVFVDYDVRESVRESAFVKRWKSEGDAETHAEIIRCAMAWEPSRAGRRWRARTRPGRRAGDKVVKGPQMYKKTTLREVKTRRTGLTRDERAVEAADRREARRKRTL